MKNAKMSTILVLRSELLRKVALVLGLVLMVWSAPIVHGAQYLTVNGQDVTSITLELGQSRTVEVVSTDGTSYVDYVGFDNGVVRGTFSHLETRTRAGDLADVTEYNEPAFYGYYVNAAGFRRLPSAGVHFVFEYVAQELGKTYVKLYDSTFKSLIDSVKITVIPLQPVAIGTAFTYQGRLLDVNSPADGLYDFQFKLYDNADSVFAAQQGSTIDINDLDVIDGHFVVELDFGSGIFDGNAVWLETRVVRSPLGSDPATLSPLVELTPTPYALYAKTAGGDGDWTVSGNNMYSIPSGNVGIGTMSPGAGLHLKGTDYPSSFMYLQSDADEDTGFRLYEGTAVKWHLFNDSAADGLSLRNNAYSSILFAEQSTGNVGIGTTSPGAPLEVKKTIGFGVVENLLVLNSDNAGLDGGGAILFKGFGTDPGRAKIEATYQGTLDGDLRFYTNSLGTATGLTEKMRITPGGNVGIGTTSPDAKLDITAAGDGAELLQFSTERPWVFRQRGTGVLTALELHSSAGEKSFVITAWDGTQIAEFTDRGTTRVIVPVLEITGGSDLSEQFEVSDEGGKVKPGMVVCIDADNSGSLVVSKESYDRTVAGIVSGAGGVKPGMLMAQKGTKADGEYPVALTGRVYCWADASNGPIEPGDLLTTSDMAGHAMKVTDYTKAQGAILGKAMSSLEKGKGLVLVLVSLQ